MVDQNVFGFIVSFFSIIMDLVWFLLFSVSLKWLLFMESDQGFVDVNRCLRDVEFQVCVINYFGQLEELGVDL